MLHLQKSISPPVLPQADITRSVWQQQSLILHLFTCPDLTASASAPDTSQHQLMCKQQQSAVGGVSQSPILSLILTLEVQRSSSSPAVAWKQYQHWLTLVQHIKISYQEDIIWPWSTLVCTAQNIRQLENSFKVVPPLSPTTNDKKMTV